MVVDVWKCYNDKTKSTIYTVSMYKKRKSAPHTSYPIDLVPDAVVLWIRCVLNALSFFLAPTM